MRDLLRSTGELRATTVGCIPTAAHTSVEEGHGQQGFSTLCHSRSVSRTGQTAAPSAWLTLMPTQHMRVHGPLSPCTVMQRDMVEGEDGFVAKQNSCLQRFSGIDSFRAYLNGGNNAGALLVRMLPTVVVAAFASFFMARFM